MIDDLVRRKKARRGEERRGGRVKQKQTESQSGEEGRGFIFVCLGEKKEKEKGDEVFCVTKQSLACSFVVLLCPRVFSSF